MQPWVFFLIFIIIVLVAYIYITRRNAKRRALKYEGKIIVLFWSNTGWKFYLCTENQNEVNFPKEFVERYGVEPTTVRGSVKLKNPETNTEEKYFIQPQFLTSGYWPPERKRTQQVKLPLTVFYAGIPLPIIGINCNLWKPDTLQTLATQIIGLSNDATELKAMSAQDSTFWNNIEWIKNNIMKIKTTQLAAFASAIFSLIAVIMVLQLSGKLGDIHKYFFGG